MKFNNSEYELVGEQNGKLIVRVKHMDNQTIEVTNAQGNIIFDFDHQQYNSDHRNERHQDKFFKQGLSDPDMNMMDTLADRNSIEVTSIFGKDSLLDKIIEKEDCQSRQMLAEQLPTALATLTSKQKYAVIQYYCHGMKKIKLLKRWASARLWPVVTLKPQLKSCASFTELKIN